jgi:hypothetical protein
MSRARIGPLASYPKCDQANEMPARKDPAWQTINRPARNEEKMKQVIAVHRVTNARELLMAVADMNWPRAEEVLSNVHYQLSLYEETLSDGSKTLNFWIREHPKAQEREGLAKLKQTGRT